MELSDLMELRPGITAVIGGSGKTEFLQTAGEELLHTGSVLLCTTSGMKLPPNACRGETLDELRTLAHQHSVVWGGPLTSSQTLAPLTFPLDQLLEWYSYILVKADQAHGYPLVGHAPGTSLIPAHADQVIAIIGASAFGKEIRDAAWNPDPWALSAGVTADVPVTPENAAQVLQQENLHHRVFVNQVERVEQFAWVSRFTAYMNCPVAAGSITGQILFPCNELKYAP